MAEAWRSWGRGWTDTEEVGVAVPERPLDDVEENNEWGYDEDAGMLLLLLLLLLLIHSYSTYPLNTTHNSLSHHPSLPSSNHHYPFSPPPLTPPHHYPAPLPPPHPPPSPTPPPSTPPPPLNRHECCLARAQIGQWRAPILQRPPRANRQLLTPFYPLHTPLLHPFYSFFYPLLPSFHPPSTPLLPPFIPLTLHPSNPFTPS